MARSSQAPPTCAAPPVVMHLSATQHSCPCGQHIGDRKLSYLEEQAQLVCVSQAQHLC